MALRTYLLGEVTNQSSPELTRDIVKWLSHRVMALRSPAGQAPPGGESNLMEDEENKAPGRGPSGRTVVWDGFSNYPNADLRMALALGASDHAKQVAEAETAMYHACALAKLKPAAPKPDIPGGARSEIKKVITTSVPLGEPSEFSELEAKVAIDDVAFQAAQEAKFRSEQEWRDQNAAIKARIAAENAAEEEAKKAATAEPELDIIDAAIAELDWRDPELAEPEVPEPEPELAVAEVAVPEPEPLPAKIITPAGRAHCVERHGASTSPITTVKLVCTGESDQAVRSTTAREGIIVPANRDPIDDGFVEVDSQKYGGRRTKRRPSAAE